MAIRETVAQVAARLWPGVTVDYALPQQWVDAQSWDPRGHVVWGYPAGSIWGKPLPISDYGKEMLIVDYMNSCKETQEEYDSMPEDTK